MGLRKRTECIDDGLPAIGATEIGGLQAKTITIEMRMRIDEAGVDELPVCIERILRFIFFEKRFIAAGFQDPAIFDGHGLLLY